MTINVYNFETMKKLFNLLPIQWRVFEGHWVKTTWKYVLTRKFNSKNLKLTRP